MAVYLIVETYSKRLMGQQEWGGDSRHQEVICAKGAGNEQCLLEVLEGDPAYQSIEDDEEGNGAESLSLSYDSDAHDAAEFARLRAERDAKLVACDWTQLTDVALTETQVGNWATYRQELRDLPANVADIQEFDWDEDWPSEPAE